MDATDDWRSDRVGSALRGEDSSVVARVPGGFVAMGDAQFLPGYCVLLTDDPAATRLSDLTPAARRDYLEILGNHSPFLHTHVWPRYDWEPAEVVQRPVWIYPVERWHDPATALGPRHDGLRRSIAARLTGRPGGTPPERP